MNAMKSSLKTTFAALTVGTGVLAGGQSAHALEAGQCFAKSDQAKILADAGQNRIIGGIEPTFLEDNNGKLYPTTMKITFTSSRDNKTGFVLSENGCKPVVAHVSEAQVIGVHVTLAVRNTKIFNNKLVGIPLNAMTGADPVLAQQMCEKIVIERSHDPDFLAEQEEEYSQKLNEDLFNKVASVHECFDLNKALNNAKTRDHGVMYQAESVLSNGQPGALFTVIGKPDKSGGQILLSTKEGSTVRGGAFSSLGYLDDAETFINPEKTAALELK